MHKGRKNILIDDRPHNIFAWEKQGGIAIRFQANQDKLEVISSAFGQITDPVI